MIPKSVMVFGQEYQVVRSDLSDRHLYGYCDNEKRQIHLEKTLKGEKLIQTYLHEVFHAIWYRIGLSQAHISIDVEEIVVESLSNWLIENYEFN